jgi:hypothetical protein
MPSTFPIANILFNQGATFQKLFIYQDSTLNPINLTGYTARMQLRATYTSETPVINLTTENGGIEITPLDGEILVKMTAAQTEGIPARDYYYDIEVESADGRVYRVIEGKATVRPEITRSQGL